MSKPETNDTPLPKPVDFDQLYPGRFLKAGEFLGKNVTLTIAAVDLEELEGDKGKKVRGIVSFAETPKQLCLNRTNGLALKAMLGRQVQEWRGKRVTLCPSVVESGSMKGQACIRLFGSPDLPSDLDVVVQLPKKRPFTMTMRRTSAKVGPAAAEPNAPATREPGDDE